MAPAPPLRVGLVGLSSSAITSWAAHAHLPCFQTAAGRERLQIVALCNSSVAAAESSIKTYGLPPSTKAYGSPVDLAADPDVDFVICNTRVDKHYDTVLPSIQAGKDVYIEWPIASNKADIYRLVEATKNGGGKTLVGLQGRWAPPVLKIKELLQGGSVGTLLSSEVQVYGGSKDREILPVGLKYFAELAVGGNPITIGLGHVIDFIQSAVGELVPESVHTHLQLQRPDVRIRDPERDNQIVETFRSDVPDLLSLHGSITTTARPPSQPATLTVQFRRGQPFPGTPSLAWTLHGTTGEIQLIAPSGISLQADAYADPVTIRLHKFPDNSTSASGDGNGTVEDIHWEWNERQKEVPVRARSVQTVLYAYADAKRGVEAEGEEKGWVELDDAAGRAAQIGGWLEGWRV